MFVNFKWIAKGLNHEGTIRDGISFVKALTTAKALASRKPLHCEGSWIDCHLSYRDHELKVNCKLHHIAIHPNHEELTPWRTILRRASTASHQHCEPTCFVSTLSSWRAHQSWRTLHCDLTPPSWKKYYLIPDFLTTPTLNILQLFSLNTKKSMPKNNKKYIDFGVFYIII